MLPEEVIDKVKAKETRWVQLHFPDLYGNLKVKTVPSSELSTVFFTRGVFSPEASPVYGELYEEPLSLVLDPATYGTIAWGDSTDRFICNVKRGDERYLNDVRYPLERASEAFRAQFNTSPSIKQKVSFFLTDGASMERRDTRKTFDIPNKEAGDNPVSFRSSESLAFASEPKDSYGAVRQQICDVMRGFFNYNVLAHHHGVANSSQQVIHFDEHDALISADVLSTLRMASRAIALVNVSSATFMPLPYAGSAPNDLSLSIAGFLKGRNVFYDEDDEHNISPEGYSFIGGIIEHLPALTFFLNSTVNSYKRLAVSPKFTSASLNDPYSAISIQPSPGEYNITLTSPDPLVNPYFALAAVLAAGVDGVKKKASAEILKESPVIMSEAQRRRHKVKELPKSLEDAIEALQSDNDFLKGIFSPDLIYAYTEMKVNELKEDQQTPSSFDYMNYFHL